MFFFPPVALLLLPLPPFIKSSPALNNRRDGGSWVALGVGGEGGGGGQRTDYLVKNVRRADVALSLAAATLGEVALPPLRPPFPQSFPPTSLFDVIH